MVEIGSPQICQHEIGKDPVEFTAGVDLDAFIGMPVGSEVGSVASFEFGLAFGWRFGAVGFNGIHHRHGIIAQYWHIGEVSIAGGLIVRKDSKDG
jgi:hypothetical protein